MRSASRVTYVSETWGKIMGSIGKIMGFVTIVGELQETPRPRTRGPTPMHPFSDQLAFWRAKWKKQSVKLSSPLHATSSQCSDTGWAFGFTWIVSPGAAARIPFEIW